MTLVLSETPSYLSVNSRQHCSCVSGGFIIIGIIIYGAEAEGILDEYSGAFAITIIAGIIALVAGILALLDWMGKGQ